MTTSGLRCSILTLALITLPNDQVGAPNTNITLVNNIVVLADGSALPIIEARIMQVGTASLHYCTLLLWLQRQGMAIVRVPSTHYAG